MASSLSGSLLCLVLLLSPTSGSASFLPSTRSLVGTTSASGPAAGLPPGWAYRGCYTDGVAAAAFAAPGTDDPKLTVESCVLMCQKGYNIIAGIQNGSQCFCGNTTNNVAFPDADTACNTPCSGNPKEICGGASHYSIYSATPTNLVQPNAWAYQGCITEGANGPPFEYLVNYTTFNNAVVCGITCGEFGFGAIGLEQGDQCWCGDVDKIAAVGSTTVPETECNVPCPGNVQYVCGGTKRLTYYTWKEPDPLHTWAYPTGGAAGQYQQFIGGVCVPLLTTMGVNGKVTFVAKYGTGEVNSTGAYELDPTQVNHLALAWRPMHVQTDVFGSASITLPDKVGRQINIGGWTAPSTSAVRLYWPDGYLGVPGTHDWQENGHELSLQVGRRYPSAVVMGNGSILVAGGETIPNGPGAISLEILPRPAGGTVVTLDALPHTYPFNFYPFLAVLPSGHILIIYYNEAKLIDAATLTINHTLGILPGNPSDDVGRTYPYEGTAVLMPQHAPYTDPLTVMVCGGSTHDGIASDNCVSAQPDAFAEWSLERMPSPRVMSCIAALPDGTFLILNGAQAGTAGFKLGLDPNLNAVLYDPAKPRNSRFSVMANTTVARMFHSEAILMQDGRVLVSGSDPQDGVHPEEYRVEVFVPPYLLANLPRPQFTLVNKDWAYGATVQLTATIPSGNMATARVSLLAAVSNTHGNSMGQRTLFPAVSCAGNTCTLTTPPNANIAPPGWYQVFLLDGPTPSVSTWVRLGGDPAQLGHWPAFPDFQTPGV